MWMETGALGSFGELTSENVFEAWSECCPETIGSFVLEMSDIFFSILYTPLILVH